MNALQEVLEMVERLEAPQHVAEAEAEMTAFMQTASPTEQFQIQESVGEKARLLLEELDELKIVINKYLGISGIDTI
ncbi:hypothetical protein [Tellurirhabdus rosea]|uniref:hypothetical protein n=1 Tax=Tellurirhabdus rosea TaxID=2674997 RepID=UPI00225113E2|nr:hypothetical protein [Tellurirhabdus rosea]